MSHTDNILMSHRLHRLHRCLRAYGTLLMDKRVGLLVNFNTNNMRESIKRIVN